MKYVVILNDGYEVGYDIFDTEEELLEFINRPFNRSQGITVFKGEELQVLTVDGKKVLSNPKGG